MNITGTAKVISLFRVGIAIVSKVSKESSTNADKKKAVGAAECIATWRSHYLHILRHRQKFEARSSSSAEERGIELKKLKSEIIASL